MSMIVEHTADCPRCHAKSSMEYRPKVSSKGQFTTTVLNYYVCKKCGLVESPLNLTLREISK